MVETHTMQKIKIDVKRIEYVSLHFDNGESKGYRKEELDKLTIQLSLGIAICFAVFNIKGVSGSLIVVDLKELHEFFNI